MSTALALGKLGFGSQGFGAAEVVEDARPKRMPPRLSQRQKAAVIVRLLLAEGAPLPLQALPEELQAELTRQLTELRLIDRDTLSAVIEEFSAELDSVGLSFPGGIDSALSLLNGHISSGAANRLRRMAAAAGEGDAWDRIIAQDTKELLPLLEQESVEVGAVLLSKLGVTKAAELLGKLPGDKARRIAYAVSLTSDVDPETVRRIGLSLASQIEAKPPRAFPKTPVERVGAILNFAADEKREEVLQGLEETDSDFAERVRRAIFTFRNIPERVEQRDIAKVVRAVEQRLLILALASAQGEDRIVADFILDNMSQRLAATLRDEMAELRSWRDKDAEAARNAVVAAIRTLEADGDIILIQPEEE
ncbi:flagellar motor switch protein FliG [Plastorhodobacter daqingensis]|uniref:Flagellar motor switch protein FliG n=1 Tax=Plastorhodobacter daqingensis TaxID=1387281 RepID=A0ABW2UF48_9RHOB